MIDLKKCPKCGSEQIARKLMIFYSADGGANIPAQIGYYKNPDALFFKGGVASDFHADACAECGYLEFYLKTPGKFRNQAE
ncbi:MAG: hypothetical protein QNL68_21110 [Akkermansiaceae bacterium]|jgi:predicted nucleic-acid-binding Zn-ribbon protein